MVERRSIRAMFGLRRPRDRRDRAEPRTPMLVDAELMIGPAHFTCRIVNAAPAGLRLKLDHDQQLSGCSGQQMMVRLTNGTVLPAFLRWVRGSDVGLRLSTPIEVRTLLDSAGARLLMPRAGRAQITMATSIAVGETVYRGRLHNISAGGALLSTDAQLNEGTALFLHSELVRPLGGYVRWRARGQIGIMFNRLLPVDTARVFARRYDIHDAWIAELEAMHRDCGAT